MSFFPAPLWTSPAIQERILLQPGGAMLKSHIAGTLVNPTAKAGRGTIRRQAVEISGSGFSTGDSGA
jgi:hypothetical protein